MAAQFIWNIDKTRAVKASQVKEFSLINQYTGTVLVQAWIGKEDCITVGEFDSPITAQEFVERFNKE